jgi:hypothetical protein
MESGTKNDGDSANEATKEDPERSRPNKFRFKSKHRSRDTDSHDLHRHRRRHHHGYHRSSKRQKTSSSSEHVPSKHEQQQPASLSPNTAFRESLFDALGDDEGAAFWESVYGQPIHTYPNARPGPEGELEQMDEEEYATYVRARMWERTHQGLLEERERRRLEREKEKERAKERAQADGGYKRKDDSFERAVEESLSRGRERRKKKAWIGIWERYLRSWDQLNSRTTAAPGDGADKPGDEKKVHLRNLICWPVESGKRSDISCEAVESFIRHAPGDTGSNKVNEIDTSNILKMERVRWHPDKIQQRYGALGIEEPVMKSVTEVFQILDRMWNEEKEKTKVA